jgi:serine/threonine-protein kinase RsbW
MSSEPSALSAADEETPLSCQPSRLSIPNDPRFVEAACRYLDEVSKLTGFEDLLRQQIVEGTRRALLTLLRYSFEPYEEAFIEIVSEWIPAGLKISLRDQGLPLNTEAFEKDDTASENPLYGLNAYFDEVRFQNRGREGKEVMLFKHLPDPSMTAYAVACGLGPPNTPEAGHTAAISAVHCTARPLKPSEAHEVSKAVYKAYGYSYPHDFVYYPEKIAELNRSGEIFSVVAVAGNNEIAGHCSLKQWEENPRIAEMVQGVVKPQFRSQGCFAKMTEYLIETARSKGLAGIFGEAVTAHPYSQKTALEFGLRDCAVFLGLIPAMANFKGLGGGTAERGSMLVQFRYLKMAPSTPVHAPASHRTMIAAIFRNLGTAPDFRAEQLEADEPTAADTGITVKLSRSLNLARIRIDSYGRNVIDLLRGQIKALCFQNWDVIHLLLDLSNPATAHFCGRFEELGFFFAGMLPCGLPSGDALILQYLNNFTIAYESIKTASPFTRKLVTYVQDLDPNRNPHHRT